MESRPTLRKSLVFAPKEGKEGSELAYRRLAAWLISFEQVLAMHSGPIHDWSGTVRAPRPDGFKTGAWKV